MRTEETLLRLSCLTVGLDLLLLLSPGWCCSQQLANCTRLVGPFLNDPAYMFPVSPLDVEEMCRLWSQVVECVRRYMTACSSDDQRSRFNGAVGEAVDTVHAVCSSDRYQQDYLETASCLRSMALDVCGNFFSQLVSQVTNPRSEDDHICCSYVQFRKCVGDGLLRQCGTRAASMLDHSMAYLVGMCGSAADYPMHYQCPVAPPPPPTPPTPVAIYVPPPDPTTWALEEDDPSFSTWFPPTIVYTLPPLLQSRLADSGGSFPPPSLSLVPFALLSLLNKLLSFCH